MSYNFMTPRINERHENMVLKDRSKFQLSLFQNTLLLHDFFCKILLWTFYKKANSAGRHECKAAEFGVS